MRPVAIALALLALVPAAGQAVPGDPPITSISPDDSATFGPDLEGVPVAFECPAYYLNEFRRDNGIVSDPGDGYGVRVSRSPQTGPGGLLASSIDDTLDAQGRVRAQTSVCDAQLGNFQSGISGSERWQGRPGGPYYWQPYRLCETCDGEVEAGPVRSFSIVGDPSSVVLRAKTPRRAYTGIARLVSITIEGENEPPSITLERETKSGWVPLKSVTARNTSLDRVAVFPRGRYAFRATTTLPQSGRVSSPPQDVVVTRPRRGVRGADGRYAVKQRGLRARVAHGGRILRDFRTSLTVNCPIPDPNGGINLNPSPFSFTLPPVRIAPDGRFVTAGEYKGTRVHLSGRLRAGRLRGTVVAATDQCAGRINAFDARR